jgi:SAM-dependent methyltransferase
MRVPQARWWRMKPEWSYDIIAPLYDYDMGLSMPFDDVAGYLCLLPQAPAKLLEIGCGTGRLTLELAHCGFSITAIDRSAPMLAQLRNKLRPEHDINVRLMDARRIGLSGPFDAIFFGYSGFQYLLTSSDSALFFIQAKRILAPSGSLILDIFLHRKSSETSGFVLDYERSLKDGRVVRRWKRVSVDHGINYVERKYIVTGAGEQQEYRTESRQRLYTPKTLVAELKKHGFELDTGIFDYQLHTCSANGPQRFFTARFIPAANLP